MSFDAESRKQEAFQSYDAGAPKRAMLVVAAAILMELKRIADALEGKS